MLLKCLIGLLFLCYVVFSSPTPAQAPISATHRHLLGSKECTWGPSYWCKNVTSAKSCGAVKHCIQSVWQYQTLPEDNDDICQICKTMVQDARDQLESNETVDEMKQVLEGSCKLIYLKPAVKLCKKLADDLVPELVDMISSQMDPQIVCSVAGLCNNAEIDKMLDNIADKKAKEAERNKELQQYCSGCLDFADVLKERLDKSTSDDLKTYLLERCRSLGSFTDACSNIILSNFDAIQDRLKNHFTSPGFCHLMASCNGNYTRKVQVKTESNVGVVHLNNDAVSVAVKHLSDDQTCDLCKQLVKHLKDILVADTTELEFKQVLEGICKQTGKFADECHSIVDEYYNKFYEFIVQDINGAQICGMVGICPGPGVYVNGPIWPLLPAQPVPIQERITGNDERIYGSDQRIYGRVSVSKSDSNVKVIEAHPPIKVEIAYGDAIDAKKAQLPIDRILVMTPQHADIGVNNKETCVFCQYILHYIQKVITQPYGVKEIKDVVDKVCNEMPHSVRDQCTNFVDIYGDAFVAILAQEIDPSQVCPSLHICPARELKDKYEPIELTGKPGCPLCLMAVEEVYEKLKDNKTEDDVRDALDTLCNRLSENLKGQCIELVKKYTDQLIEMILADFTPQEVCTYLKLCSTSLDVELLPPHTGESMDIMTNEIPQTSDEFEEYKESKQEKEEMTGIKLKPKASPVCILCEFVMEKVDQSLRDNATEADIRRAVLRACRALPSTIRGDCNDFLNKYSEVIVQFLSQLMDPVEVCTAMKLCLGVDRPVLTKAVEQMHAAVQECAMCEALVGAVDALLEDNQFDRNLSKYASKICQSFPTSKQEQCKGLLISYGPSIINLIVEMGAKPSAVCARMNLCDQSQQMKVNITPAKEDKSDFEQLVGGNRCTWGPSYWCQTEEHAHACGTLAHCREIVWKSEKPNL